MELVNEARRDAPLPALEVDTRLQEAARRHVNDMARGGFSGHEGSDASLPADRAAAAAYPWVFVAENTAAGRSSARATFEGWEESPPHLRNIRSERARHVGIARADREGSAYGFYWVMVFGNADGPSRQPADGCVS